MKTNLLAQEKSPYLLQHAHNPVDWMPWGEAAFARAREENKPIFLSIGYSTCHWCHVMERESFESEALAEFLNAHFVSVKVDREERPDVDRLYMTFVQSATGSGGWPMTVFLTPDLAPFFGGTYFPPADKWGRPGFGTLLQRIAGSWQNDRARIDEAAENAVASLQSIAAQRPANADADWNQIAQRGAEAILGEYDSRLGGFGDAPKFPRPVTHHFLHRFHAATGDAAALHASAHTLKAMARGGMNDQIGGGFHRYSVDEFWVVPHFEKMLYDQAQLVTALVEAWQLTQDSELQFAARETLRYVARDLTHENGGFFAAEDADSLAMPSADHKIEGAFYVWKTSETEEILGDDAAAFCEKYNVSMSGNAPQSGDPHGEFAGLNILFRTASTTEIDRTAEDKLFAVREQRPRPHRDEKIISAWNGLMIGAFARAGAAFGDADLVAQAARAAAFIRAELWNEETKTLLRFWQSGASDALAFADDYAFLARGLADLFEASGDIQWLLWAEQLVETLERDFRNEAGAYFNALPDPNVLLRFSEDYDGAEPAASSYAAHALQRLGWLLDRPDLLARSERILAAFAARMRLIPHSMPELIGASLTQNLAPVHVVITGQGESADALWREANRDFRPSRLVIRLRESSEELRARLPYLAAMQSESNKAAAFVCRDFACRAPVSTVEELRAALA